MPNNDPILPGQHGELVTPARRATPWFYLWLQKMEALYKRVQVQADATEAAVAAIPETDPTVIHPSGSINVYGDTDVGYTLEVNPDALASRSSQTIVIHEDHYSESWPVPMKGDKGDPGTPAAAGSGTTIVINEEHYEDAWPIVPQSAGGGASTAAAVSISDAGGYFTGTDVEAALQELGASGGGGGAMTFLGTATVSGSATTTFTLSSLDLGAYKAFMITGALKSAGGATASVYLLYNGDTTLTNYFEAQAFSNNNTGGYGSVNDGRCGSLYSGQQTTLDGIIQKDIAGNPKCRMRSLEGAFSVAALVSREWGHVRNNTANVTSISISSSVANQLDVGSKFSVWGLN